MTRSASPPAATALVREPGLLLADGTAYVASPGALAGGHAVARRMPGLMPLRTGGRHALPEPDPEPPLDPPPPAAPAVDPAPAEPAPADPTPPPPADKPVTAWLRAPLGILAILFAAALGAWAMFAMLAHVALALEARYPDLYLRGADVPLWQGRAAAAVIAVDVGIIGLTIGDLWLRTERIYAWWLRPLLGAFMLLTIGMNYGTGADLLTGVLHSGGALCYVAMVELLHVRLTGRRERRRRRRSRGTRHVPLTQWLVEFGSARRMTFEMLTERIDYAEALARRARRRAARAAFEQAFGPEWRGQVPLPVADAYRRGAVDAVDPVRLVVDARRMHAELGRELARLDSVTHPGEPTLRRSEPLNEPPVSRPSEPPKRGNEPPVSRVSESADEPSGAHVLTFKTPVASADSPSESLSESTGGAVPPRLAAGQGPRSEPNREAINAVLAGRYESGESAAKAIPGASKATVNRWLSKLGWRGEGATA